MNIATYTPFHIGWLVSHPLLPFHYQWIIYISPLMLAAHISVSEKGHYRFRWWPIACQEQRNCVKQWGVIVKCKTNFKKTNFQISAAKCGHLSTSIHWLVPLQFVYMGDSGLSCSRFSRWCLMEHWLHEAWHYQPMAGTVTRSLRCLILSCFVACNSPCHAW